MKEPMTAKQFALVFWGPIIGLTLLIGAWAAMSEYNRSAEAGAAATIDMQRLSVELNQQAAQDAARAN